MLGCWHHPQRLKNRKITVAFPRNPWFSYGMWNALHCASVSTTTHNATALLSSSLDVHTLHQSLAHSPQAREMPTFCFGIHYQAQCNSTFFFFSWCAQTPPKPGPQPTGTQGAGQKEAYLHASSRNFSVMVSSLVSLHVLMATGTCIPSCNKNTHCCSLDTTPAMHTTQIYSLSNTPLWKLKHSSSYDDMVTRFT